jgi:hypothetical protein
MARLKIRCKDLEIELEDEGVNIEELINVLKKLAQDKELLLDLGCIGGVPPTF